MQGLCTVIEKLYQVDISKERGRCAEQCYVNMTSAFFDKHRKKFFKCRKKQNKMTMHIVYTSGSGTAFEE